VEIAKAYPDKWVAAYGKKVVAYYSSEDHQWIMVDPDCTANPEKDCFSFFVDGGVRVYQDQTAGTTHRPS
jgi:calcineurin-like phosphoesterase